MQKYRMGLLAAFLVFMMLAGTGCASLTGDKWVAKVNGEPILLKDFNARMDAAQKAKQKLGDTWEKDRAKTDAIEAMVEEKLLSQEVKKQGVDINDPKVKVQLENDKKQIGDPASFQDQLTASFTTEQNYQNMVALYLKQSSSVKVSDDDVKKFFNDNVESYGGQAEQVKAKHILVKTEDEAKQIIAQLKAGANFDQLAKDKSTDTGTKDQGGELGYFKKGQMVPEFEQAAFAQTPKTFSQDPVHTQYGYHVIFVEDHKQAVVPDFNKVKDQVAKDAQQEAQIEKFYAFYNNLRQNAKIEYAQGYKPADQGSATGK